MKLHLRIDSRNLVHTRFTTFANGANCGTLTMRNDEFDKYADLLCVGAGFRYGVDASELVYITSADPAYNPGNLTE